MRSYKNLPAPDATPRARRCGYTFNRGFFIAMLIRSRFFLLIVLGLLTFSASLSAQSAALGPKPDATLEYVVLLSRHGVRSPLGVPGALDKFSAAPWPHWEVLPGILTPHGYELIKLFGAWDRLKFSSAGLLAPSGCADAAHVTIIADTDERTRETGKALAQGMLPGCTVPVHSLHEFENDPLFRSLEAGVGHANYALATAAIAGRIGGDPNHLTAAFHSQLDALDHVLAGCGHTQASDRKRTSIFDVSAALVPGNGDRPASLRGPLPTAAPMVEDFLLEYTDGKNDAEVGWGCVDGRSLRDLMQIDTASWEYGTRTRAIARMKASNLLFHIEKSIAQSVAGKPVDGALGSPGDRLLILVGHDTNIATVAGALGIDWIVDGRVDDTPPGGALLFELWRSRSDGKPLVRLEYIAQTLEQMRQAQTLSPANPPDQEPIFLPGCSGQGPSSQGPSMDMSCSLDDFRGALNTAIDPAYVRPQR
jgi:4-phytase / acid phosphatase